MISEAVWNLGGSNTYKDVTTKTFYEREKGTNVYSGHATTWTGKIGLMYPSDYGYATSGGSTADRSTCLNTNLYNWNGVSYCWDNDWIFNKTYEWMLTPHISDSYIFYINNSGLVTYNPASYVAYDVYPAIYLDQNVKILNGKGDIVNSWTIFI